MQLTPEQANAINHAKGNLQLIACAGSGKTEVVAQHITKLLVPIAEGGMGMRPGNIIAFTFTEKAAAELKQRVIDRCRERLPGLVGMAEMYIPVFASDGTELASDDGAKDSCPFSKSARIGESECHG